MFLIEKTLSKKYLFFYKIRTKIPTIYILSLSFPARRELTANITAGNVGREDPIKMPYTKIHIRYLVY